MSIIKLIAVIWLLASLPVKADAAAFELKGITPGMSEKEAVKLYPMKCTTSHWEFVFGGAGLAYHGVIADVETAIAAAIPGLAPAESIVHLRSHKSMGWLLTPQGRCTGELIVPSFGR